MAEATIAAVRACARTLLLDSLRIDAFRGAIPHVMLIVDRVPCVLQKALLEGYWLTLEELNGALAPHAVERASKGVLSVPLDPAEGAPCGARGLGLPPWLHTSPERTRISYSVAPFQAASFLADMQRLQSFLRLCGSHNTDSSDGSAPPPPKQQPSLEDFTQRFHEVSRYLVPLPDSGVAAGGPGRGAAVPAEDTRAYCKALLNGPPRELLGCILLQRSAFQNELKQYRLRLALFNMGMRVVEHCHLESMSAPADALAAAGDYQAAMAYDEVRTYARSCSLPPKVTESLAKAIADSIDLHAWSREGQASVSSSTGKLSPPPAYTRCLENEAVWRLLHRGALLWDGEAAPERTPAATQEAHDSFLQHPITGTGAPLRIVSRKREGAAAEEEEEEAAAVLVFEGGLEDCLMNTGHYVAANEDKRNDVYAHRLRFPSILPEKEGREEVEEEDGVDERAPDDGNAAAHPHGRLKKKAYLALLESRGEKPNKAPKAAAKKADGGAAGGDSDADERMENTRARGGKEHRDGCGAGGEEEGKNISVSIGGTFPVGEVISESFDLSRLNGKCSVFAYPSLSKEVTMSKPKPFTMTIEEGCVTELSDDCPAEFVDLLSLVQQAEGGKCYVRELGIGLNPFANLQHVLADVTAFERQWGVHLSLGQRHPLFVKQKARKNADGTTCEAVKISGPVLKRKAGKYHIDVFVDAARLEIGSFAMDFTKGVVADAS